MEKWSSVAATVALTVLAYMAVLQLTSSDVTSSHTDMTSPTAMTSRPEPEANANDLRERDSVEEPAPQILATVRAHGHVHLADVDLDTLSEEERNMTLHTVLDNTDTVCARKLRMGKLGDGGWELCDDEDVRPRRPCVVYSLGINDDFSFDDDTASTYGCHVYSFDPSMRTQTHNRSQLVHFYKLGISGSTHVERHTWQQWQLYTLADLRTYLGHSDVTVDVLKMDVESAEWEALREMASSGELGRVKQLYVEFHLLRPALVMLQVLQLVERAGFRKFLVHKNEVCTVHYAGMPGAPRGHCYEVHYVRRPGG